jgi:hypothetical protein
VGASIVLGGATVATQAAAETWAEANEGASAAPTAAAKNMGRGCMRGPQPKRSITEHIEKREERRENYENNDPK